jgi:hypothetical protein
MSLPLTTTTLSSHEREKWKYSFTIPTLELSLSPRILSYRFHHHAPGHTKLLGGVFIICLFINSVNLFQLVYTFVVSICIWSILLMLFPVGDEEKQVVVPEKLRKMKQDVKKMSAESPL